MGTPLQKRKAFKPVLDRREAPSAVDEHKSGNRRSLSTAISSTGCPPGIASTLVCYKHMFSSGKCTDTRHSVSRRFQRRPDRQPRSDDVGKLSR